jgi:hypothetical protein
VRPHGLELFGHEDADGVVAEESVDLAVSVTALPALTCSASFWPAAAFSSLTFDVDVDAGAVRSNDLMSGNRACATPPKSTTAIATAAIFRTTSSPGPECPRQADSKTAADHAQQALSC